MSDVNDELDGSPILEEVLGDALGKLKVFHVKLAAEGEPRGLIGPRDVGIVVGNDLHGRTVVTHAHFDIALVVDDVKQSFKVIGSDVSFVIELIDGFLSILRHGVLLL